MVFTSSRYALRWERMALASAAASSRRSFRSRCSVILSEASANSMLEVSMAFQMTPSRRFTSSSSSSTVLSLLRCSPATPSISSSTALTSSVMLPSVRMLERILSTIICSNRRALSLGVWQASLPRFMMDWQT